MKNRLLTRGISHISACMMPVVPVLVAVGVMIIPEFVALMMREEGVAIFSIPVYQTNYAYTVFPVIFLIFLWKGLRRK